MKEFSEQQLKDIISKDFRKMIDNNPATRALYEKSKKELASALKKSGVEMTYTSLTAMIEGIKVYNMFKARSETMGMVLQAVLVRVAEDMREQKERIMKGIKI